MTAAPGGTAPAGAACAAGTDRPAPSRIKAGEYADFAFGTPHPYPPGDPSEPTVWEQTVTHPGATYMTVHLTRLELAPGDYLAVRDFTGKERERVTGRGPAGTGKDIWTPAVDGDVVTLTLHAAGRGSDAERYGLEADIYAHGLLPLGGPLEGESICGVDNRRDVKCYEFSHPTEYSKARPVGRLLISGAFFCTGWLVSCEGHVMTNAHCADTLAEVQGTQMRMLYQYTGCGTGDVTWDRTLTGKALVKTSPENLLDYTLFTINESAPEYGYLGLDPRLPETGERIYMPAHHDGVTKKFGIESDQEGAEGVNRVAEVPAPGNADDISYFMDSVGGSSGSPVLAAKTHRVIAVHHAGYENCSFGGNLGVRMDLIYPEIRNLLPACSFSPDMLYEQHAVLDGAAVGGNGNGYADPGETFRLQVTVRNRGTVPATAVTGTLSTTQPGVSISDAQAAFPDIPDGTTGASIDPHFTLALDAAMTCGTRIPLRLDLATAQGTFTVNFTLAVGRNLGGPVLYNSTTPVPIPDFNTTGTTSTISVPDAFAIVDAQVQPRITHTSIDDLVVELRSPAGTTVRLHANSGRSRDNLHDWYDREVLPDGPGTMNDFNGQNSAGTWTLKAVDSFPFDAGVITGWSLELSRADNFVCEPAGPAQTPGEPSRPGTADPPLLVTGYNAGNGQVTVTYGPACAVTNHAAFSGPLASVASLAWDRANCGLGTSGTASFDPGTGSRYFVIVGQSATAEGSYGRRSNGTERPEALGVGACDRPRDLGNPCP